MSGLLYIMQVISHDLFAYLFESRVLIVSFGFFN